MKTAYVMIKVECFDTCHPGDLDWAADKAAEEFGNYPDIDSAWVADIQYMP